MSDQIRLQLGAPPWRPTPSSEIVLELDRYDMPTAGVIEQGGCLYMFECLEGVVEWPSLWAYARIEDWEFRELQSLTGEELVHLMNHLWQWRDVAVALSVHDKIRTGSVVDAKLVRKVGIAAAAASRITDLINEEESAAFALSAIGS